MALRLAGHAANSAIVLLAIGVALLTLGPRVFGYQALPVLTGSMAPAIPTGSLVVVAQVPAAQVGVGDVITFHHPQRPRDYVTHRVVAVEDAPAGRALTTKGDANAQPDAWKVIGTDTGYRYVFAVPHVGGAIVAFTSSPFRTVLFVLPMLVLAFMALVRIWRPEPTAAPEAPKLEPVSAAGD